jgi:phage shock protein A
MGIINRAKLILRIQSSAALDALEDPSRVLDYAVQAQRELLRRVNLGLIEVATSRQRLIRQASVLRAKISTFEQQARRSLAAGREDLARIALERKQTTLNEIASIETDIAALDEEERQLAAASKQVAARIEQFSSRRIVVNARYEAAEARARVGESITGIAGEIADLLAAVSRIEEKTEQLNARAGAIDALIASGMLTVAWQPDHVETELQMINTKQAMEEELERLKAAMHEDQEER